MPFDFAKAKAQVRRIVHTTLAIDAEYMDDSLLAPQPLRIRWHNKLMQFGDLENAGYSTVIDGINRVIFDRDELLEKGVTISRGGRLKITAAGYDNAELAMDTKDELAGPTEEIWIAGKL